MDIRCLQETHFRLKDTQRLKIKGWKKIFHENGNKGTKARVAILTPDKTDFKTKAIQETKKALAGVAQWIEHWTENQSHQFDSQSGHMPGLWARSPLCVCGRGALKRQPHIDVSLLLFLPPFPSLKINK